MWITWAPLIPDPELPEIKSPADTEKKKHSEGCSCKKCQTFYPYAAPPEDETEFICWGCRHGY